jgi:hypothetical protein
MPDVILNCPQCGRALRVAEHLLGRLVQCPACGLNLSVPAAGAAPQAVPVQPIDSPAAPYPVPGAAYARDADFDVVQGDTGEAARSLVTGPAVCLLITGILGLVVDLGQVAYAAFAKPARIAQADGNDPWQQLALRVEEANRGPMPIVMGAAFALVSFVVTLAALQMLRLRTHAFAIAGSVLAMLNLGNCCCLLGLPFGIWSLVALSKPEVRSAFQ